MPVMKKTKSKLRSKLSSRADSKNGARRSPGLPQQRTYSIPDYRLEKPSFTVRQTRKGDECCYEVSGDLSAVDEYGCTALHHAADKGSNRALLALLRHGARTDLPTSKGATALAPKTFSLIDRAAKWGVIKKNTAARYKSRLTLRLRKIATA